MKEPLIKANRVFKYSITFQETNEESREVSDFSDSGFIIENETDEIGDILKLAQQTYGIYYPISFGVWESTTPEQNAKYFEKGIETYYALFIENEDGTAIIEEEYDFITFLLSDGNYNKSEFTDYAVGGVVLGALALGVGGLIAYYYFNKRKKGYPTGSAWTKEHYHDNEDEDYEVEPSKRKVPARNRKFVNGGGVDGGIANENLIVYFESGKGESFIYRITKLNGEELYASWLGSSATKEIIELKYKLESKYSKFIFNNDHSDSRYYGVIVINDGKVEEYNTNTDKWLNKKRELGLEKFVNGGKTEAVYIEFLNKEKGYKKDVKHFNSYEEAVEWARKNFDKFDYDMIKYKYDNGGGVGDKIDLLKDELEKLGIYVEKSLDIEKIPYLRIFPTNDPDVIENFFFINKQGKYEMGNHYYFGESEKAYVFDNRKQIVDFVKSEKFETIKERELKEQKRQSEKEEWLSPLQRLKKNRYVDGGGVEGELKNARGTAYYVSDDSRDTYYDSKSQFYRFVDKGIIKTYYFDVKVKNQSNIVQAIYDEMESDGLLKNGEYILIIGFELRTNYDFESELPYDIDEEEYDDDEYKGGGGVGEKIYLENPYNQNGGFSKDIAKDNISEIMNHVSFRKFGNEFRKHIDRNFTQENNIERVNTGISWSELASYIVGDGDYDVEQEQYENFIKSFNTTYTKNEYKGGGGVDEVKYFYIKGRNEDAPQPLKDTYGEFYTENDLIEYLNKWKGVKNVSFNSITKVYNNGESKDVTDFYLKNTYSKGKYSNGGTTTTRPTTTPEVVPDTDTKPRKPKTPYTPKHTPLIKPKARKYDFILIKK